jgi:hypothetical protein
MKFKPLVWTNHESGCSALAYYKGEFVWLLAFFRDEEWHLHFDNEDPSEHIASGTISNIQWIAQELHNQSVIEDFMEVEE